MTLKNITLLVSACALAVLSGAAAFGSSVGRFRPELAIGIPVGDGPVLATAAQLRLAQSANSGGMAAQKDALFPKNVDDDVLTLAQRAFEIEPMSVDAITIMALAAYGAGHTENARELFEQGTAISRRNSLANLWLAQDAALRGRVKETLRYFDQLLRTSRESRPLLLEQFALATVDRSFRGEMANLLRKEPPWAKEFWEIAPNVKPAAASVGELRLTLAGTGKSFDRYSDERIAVNLIDTGNADLAMRLYRAIADTPEASAGVILRNADFSHPRQFPPIDWQTFSSGDRGSEIVPADSLLFLFAINGPEAAVARQFVLLPTGTYAISARMRSTSRAAKDSVSLKIYCSQQSGAGLSIVVPLGEGTTRRIFEIPADSCHERWLDILTEPEEGSPGFDAELDFVKIERVG